MLVFIIMQLRIYLCLMSNFLNIFFSSSSDLEARQSSEVGIQARQAVAAEGGRPGEGAGVRDQA